MKIAVLGSTGMLGSIVADYLAEGFNVTPVSRRELDVNTCSYKDLENVVASHDWIINCIGIIPQRSNDARLMRRVNGEFPEYLAKFGKQVIQIASDCAYTGLKGDYTETDERDASDSYGMSKKLGEIKAPDFYNLRCSIIGREPSGNYSLLSWLLSQPSRASVNGYVNYFWNGITTLAFAKICGGIIQSGIAIPNTQHIVPANWTSKYKLLRMIADIYGREDIKIYPHQEGRGVIDRRLSTIRPRLNTELWRLAGYSHLPTIEEMVREFAEYKAGVMA